MTKQEQIEEMADILCESKNHDCNGEDCKCIKQATDLYNEGYRKIPKNTEVLTKEELKKLTEEINFWHKINETALILTKEECDHKVILDEDHFERALNYERENVRKETAKEILTYLWKQRNIIGQLMVFEEDLIELAKQFGVEVEE